MFLNVGNHARQLGGEVVDLPFPDVPPEAGEAELNPSPLN